jgi:Flp pilus assembly pilin Flp
MVSTIGHLAKRAFDKRSVNALEYSLIAGVLIISVLIGFGALDRELLALVTDVFTKLT